MKGEERCAHLTEHTVYTSESVQNVFITCVVSLFSVFQIRADCSQRCASSSLPGRRGGSVIINERLK